MTLYIFTSKDHKLIHTTTNLDEAVEVCSQTLPEEGTYVRYIQNADGRTIGDTCGMYPPELLTPERGTDAATQTGMYDRF